MATGTPQFFDPAEDCPECPARVIFARYGYAPTPPSELDDQQLPGRLWEFLYAAAGRRFFFLNTDHLSARQFYTLLWEQWLDEPRADIPLEAETNSHTIISEFNACGMNGEEIWELYYSDEGEAQRKPFDRDRFLPIPPAPPNDGDWSDGEENEKEPFSEPELEEELQATEPENWSPPSKQLEQQAIPLLPPAEITEETLTPILWTLLHNLSLQGFYLLHTDHLSDRELYKALWDKGLREPACLPGRNSRGGWFHDFLGSWDDDDFKVWLRYYATDEERRKHAAEFPTDPMPAREPRPFNRDWRLPKAPFG